MCVRDFSDLSMAEEEERKGSDTFTLALEFFIEETFIIKRF